MRSAVFDDSDRNGRVKPDIVLTVCCHIAGLVHLIADIRDGGGSGVGTGVEGVKGAGWEREWRE